MEQYYLNEYIDESSQALSSRRVYLEKLSYIEKDCTFLNVWELLSLIPQHYLKKLNYLVQEEYDFIE